MKVLVFGYFGYENNQLDGQTIKTRSVNELFLENGFNTLVFDTQSLKKKPFRILLLVKYLFECKKIVYLPGQNNLKFIFPFLFLFSLIMGKNIIYIVIGGWLENFVSKFPFHRKLLKKIKVIFVENSHILNELKDKHEFSNVGLMHNFRNVNFDPYFFTKPYSLKLVFMARVTILKGIDVLFQLDRKIKTYHPNLNITIDVYGPVDNRDKDYFYKNLNESTNIKYNGVVQPSNVYSVLSQYDVLILPTRYPGEGFPGTILDAYIAGIPVIVSKWKYLPEFVVENISGYVFELGDYVKLLEIIVNLHENKKVLNHLKKNAHMESKKYSAEKVWEKLIPYIYDK